jgi:hypothetical protein
MAQLKQTGEKIMILGSVGMTRNFENILYAAKENGDTIYVAESKVSEIL